MSRVAVAVTIDQVARPRRNRESAFAFWAYSHVAYACDILTIDIESEIGADDSTAVTGLVSQDDEWSAQVICSMRMSIYKLYFNDALEIAFLSSVLSPR